MKQSFQKQYPDVPYNLQSADACGLGLITEYVFHGQYYTYDARVDCWNEGTKAVDTLKRNLSRDTDLYKKLCEFEI